MVIEQEQKPENILESRDDLETQGAEKVIITDKSINNSFYS